MTQEAPSLGELISLVRRELEWAHQVDADHPLRFDVGVVEVDVEVEVSSNRTASGGASLKVLSIGGDASYSGAAARNTVSRVHLVLTPIDARSVTGRYRVAALESDGTAGQSGGPTRDQESERTG